MTETRPDNKVICVLSMPRSGTSLTAASMIHLQCQGPPDPIDPHPEHNPSGFFESATLLSIRIELESLLGVNFSIPACFTPIDWASAFQSEGIQFLRERAGAYFAERRTERVARFVYKDPRSIHTLPFWEQVFQDQGFAPHFVVVVRDPNAYAHSVRKFVGHSTALSRLTWLESITRILDRIECEHFTLIVYENFFERSAYIGEIAQSLLGKALDDDTIADFRARVLRPELRRSSSDGEHLGIADQLIRQLYESLADLPADNKGLLHTKAGLILRDCSLLLASTMQFIHPNALNEMLDFDRRESEWSRRVESLESRIFELTHALDSIRSAATDAVARLSGANEG
jgi:hypothetical protein